MLFFIGINNEEKIYKDVFSNLISDSSGFMNGKNYKNYIL